MLAGNKFLLAKPNGFTFKKKIIKSDFFIFPVTQLLVSYKLGVLDFSSLQL